MEIPLKVTSSQLAKFTAKYAGNTTFANGNGNNRHVQPLDHRVVRHGGVVCVEQMDYLYAFIGLYVFFNIVIVLLIKFTPKNFSRKKTAKVDINQEPNKEKYQKSFRNEPNPTIGDEQMTELNMRVDTESLAPLRSPVSTANLNSERQRLNV